VIQAQHIQHTSEQQKLRVSKIQFAALACIVTSACTVKSTALSSMHYCIIAPQDITALLPCIVYVVSSLRVVLTSFSAVAICTTPSCGIQLPAARSVFITQLRVSMSASAFAPSWCILHLSTFSVVSAGCPCSPLHKDIQPSSPITFF
jgi:hypothetical protein